MQCLLHSLAEPQRNLKTIHIAGTKGKGSTCAFLANILRAAGFKVGLYTSPHLVDVRERIRILQLTVDNVDQLTEKEKISQKDFSKIIERIKPHAERLRKTKLGELTYYEILTACAFLYFKEEQCDFAVLETGIGGRLDATNVVSSLVCAMTPISYEHTDLLGNTLEEIAKEKTGIIKDKIQIVVTAPQRPSVLRVIKRRAKKYGVTLFEVGKDIQIKKRSLSLKGQLFDLKGIFAKYSGLKIGLLGEHQIVNAAVALGCTESLRSHGIKISQEAIREGLKKTSWPGRLQIISQKPRVILDAAHCRVSACALKEALTKFFKYRNLILVLGVSQDKDIRGILKELLPSASRIILTKAQSPRALEPEAIKTFIKTNERPITLTSDSIRALEVARQNARREDLILVCGSLFLVGEVLKNQKQ